VSNPHGQKHDEILVQRNIERLEQLTDNIAIENMLRLSSAKSMLELEPLKFR
jgi:hypothetical protein